MFVGVHTDNPPAWLTAPLEDELARADRSFEAVAAAVGDDPDPGLSDAELDAWNAATARAVKVVRNFGTLGR